MRAGGTAPMHCATPFTFDGQRTTSPAGAARWKPTEAAAASLVPDAHNPTRRHAPMMFTTDLSLKEDPTCLQISRRIRDNPKDFERAFAQAWFKLTQGDSGPRARHLGPDLPEAVFAWQDPLPAVDHPLINASDITQLKAAVLALGLTASELVEVAWASASTFPRWRASSRASMARAWRDLG